MEIIEVPGENLSDVVLVRTNANPEQGTIDWYMKMPDGSIGAAYSRVVEEPDKKAIFTFILLAPPGPEEFWYGYRRQLCQRV